MHNLCIKISLNIGKYTQSELKPYITSCVPWDRSQQKDTLRKLNAHIAFDKFHKVHMRSQKVHFWLRSCVFLVPGDFQCKYR